MRQARAAETGAGAWLPAIGLLLMGSLGAAWLELRPHHEGSAPLAALFPPWWPAAEVLKAAASADVAVLRSGAWPALLIVRPGDPGAPARLRAEGAWLLLDGRAIRGCASGGRDDDAGT